MRPRHAYRLPGDMRVELAEPFGPVHSDESLAQAIGGRPVTAVGDVVSLTLKRLGIRPRVFVCDFKTARGDVSKEYQRELGSWGDHAVRVPNPAAHVTREAWDAVREAYQRSGTTRIEVDGEEDLLGIPVFLECPMDSVVVYGAPGRGVVVVTVDQQLRSQVEKLLQRLEQVPAPARQGF